MSLPDLPSLEDQISADPVLNPDNGNSNSKDQHFKSRCNPERMGNTAPIAFGGCTIAIAVHAAHQTLPPPPPSTPQKFHLYSILGTFVSSSPRLSYFLCIGTALLIPPQHGGTRVDRKLHTTVTTTRSTKTFQTRRVLATQLLDDNTTRTCADFFIDFHIDEPAFLTYDATPVIPSILSNGPTHPTQTRSPVEILQRLQDNGDITRAHADGFRAMFRMSEHYIDTRACVAGVAAHNLHGLAARVSTPQDDLPVPAKTSYEWVRTRSPAMSDQALQVTALSFIMDQALSFLPLNHTHRGFPDAGACSTLEFALRVFTPDVRIDQWHLRERRTVVANAARTFSEGRLWDEKGRMVCSMTQACILRPPAPVKGGKERSKI